MVSCLPGISVGWEINRPKNNNFIFHGSHISRYNISYEEEHKDGEKKQILHEHGSIMFEWVIADEII